MSDITIRTATDDDIRSVARLRTIDETGVRLALELAQRSGAWVARDGSEPIGWALMRSNDDERFVGDVFVNAGFRGHGVGGRLLDAAFADAGDASRLVTLAPGQPAALAAAVQRGLSPIATVLRIEGAVPKEDALLSMAAGDYRFQVDAIDWLRDGYALDALDRETRATTRADEHRRLAAEGSGLAYYKDGEFVGYAYVWPDGRIGPAAASSAAYLPQMLAYALVTLRRHLGATWCSVLLPANNARVARACLRAELRITASFGIAADCALGDLARYVAYHELLF